MMLIATALFITAPAFAQKGNILKNTTKAILKDGAEKELIGAGGSAITNSMLDGIAKGGMEAGMQEALTKEMLDQLRQEIYLLSARSQEIFAKSKISEMGQKVGPITNKQLWPDGPILEKLTKDYKTLVSFNAPSKFVTLTQFGRKIVAHDMPTAQYLLSRLLWEEAAFKSEIKNAKEMWFTFRKIGLFKETPTAEEKAEFKKAIDANIPNPTLHKDLLGYLEKEDYNAMAQDLQDYYSLGKDVSLSALEYNMRHPHGRNLAIRRALVNPFVPQHYKTDIKALLKARDFDHMDPAEFVNQITAMFKELTEYKTMLGGSEAVFVKVDNFRSFMNDLEAFIKKNGRAPIWSKSREESDLACEYVELMNLKRYGNFEPLESYYTRLGELNQKYQLEKHALPNPKAIENELGEVEVDF